MRFMMMERWPALGNCVEAPLPKRAGGRWRRRSERHRTDAMSTLDDVLLPAARTGHVRRVGIEAAGVSGTPTDVCDAVRWAGDPHQLAPCLTLKRSTARSGGADLGCVAMSAVRTGTGRRAPVGVGPDTGVGVLRPNWRRVIVESARAVGRD